MRLGCTDLLDRCTSYRAAKDSAEPFRTAKQLLYRKFRASGFGTWVTKPPEEEMFTFSPISFPDPKPLIPPGSMSSTSVLGGGLQPLHMDTVEDFT